jgi:hypothetical protein
MSNRPTTMDILKHWLNKQVRLGIYEVASHDIESELVAYGMIFHGKSRLPSAYSRQWRKLRAKQDYSGTSIKDIKELNTESVESKWKITTLNAS